jgi:hypothetical protein
MMYPAPGFGQVTQTSNQERAEKERLNQMLQNAGISVGDSPYTENLATETQEERGDISGAGIAPPPTPVAGNDLEFAGGNLPAEHNRQELAKQGAQPNFAQAFNTGGSNTTELNTGISPGSTGVEAALNVQPSNLVTDQDVQAQQDRTQIKDKFMGLSKRYNMDMAMRNA